MKRVIAWVLILTLCLGLFAGCKKDKNETPNGEATGNVADLEAALEYIKTVYRKPSEKTPKDFQRIGVVPVNGKEYEVVWTADVGEEYIKVVKGTDGMVTIDVNEAVEADVKYVLTATITDGDSSVSHSWNHILPAPNNDMVAIVEEAYKLESGKSMDYEVTLTGKITAINTPWDAGYKNITVTIAVEGAEDKPIQCYRLKGEGADKLKPNDIITVTGILKNYNGTIEFDAGCTLDAVIEGEVVKAPEDPKQILKEAYALAEGGALPYEATLTGVITKVNTEFNPQYNNVTVTMVVGGDKSKPVQCYRLAGKGAEKIGEGDTITVTGWIVNYKGTVQFGQGCTLDSWKDTGANVPKPEDTFTTTLVPEVVTKPVAGTAYKFFMYQKNYDKNFYLTGKMDGFYYETTYDPAKGADVYVEEVSGGYRLYFLDKGVKNYLQVERALGTDGKMHNNVVFTTKPTAVMKWNDAIKSFTTELDVDGTPTNFYLGTYSFYKTFSASDVSRITGENASKMDTENFVGRLAIMKETAVEEQSAEEKAYLALKEEYFVASTEATATTEDYTRKNVYEVDGKKVKVVWTEDSDAVTIVDNGDGTVTVKVTRGEEDAPYTLTATITDGDKKYTASWKCVVPAIPPVSPKDIVDAAYALEPGTAMADPVTLTGIVTEINTAYSEQYGNITVTIVVEDMLDKPIMCYRLKGEGIEDLVGLENITVTGIIKNYNGTIEFDAGCTMDACKTQAEIVDAVYALEAGAALDLKYTLLGEIISVDTPYSEQYYNITVTMAVFGCEDQPIQCYRLTGSGIELLDVGYQIAVNGTLKNYNGTYEFDKGCVLVDFAEPEVEEEEDDKLYLPKPVEAPKAGVAYKYFMYQAANGVNLYFNGTVSSGYLGTTEDLNEAVDVYVEAVEAVEGAVRFYFMDGETKTYIEIFKNSSNKIRQQLVTEATMYYTYDAENKTFVTDIEGTLYYPGTYDSYTTIGASKLSYITGENANKVGVSQYIAKLATLVPAGETIEGIEPPAKIGQAYKYFMYQASLKKALYFNGTVSSGYLGTTEDLNEAVDVYVEAVEDVEGAVRFYFMDGETKTYIEIFKNSSNKIRQQLVTEATMYYTYDAENNTYVTDIEGTLYYPGTYDSYTTIGASKLSYITGDNANKVGVSQYIAQLGSVVVKEIAPVVSEPAQEGKAYVYYMYQAANGVNLYFNGTVSSGYLGTTEDMDEAVDVYVEAVEDVEGAVRFYFMDGETKTYIEIFKNSSNKIRQQLVTEATMYYTYDAENNTYVTDIEGTLYYPGTYDSYTTIGASKLSYITGDNAIKVGVSQYIAHLATLEFVTE